MMQRLKNIIRGGEGASPAERRLHLVYLAAVLLAFFSANGIFALLLTADSCSTLWLPTLFRSYFAHPPLVLLNILPAVLLGLLGLFLTGRAWAAYLISAVPAIGFALVNYYKILLRGDPFLASDIRLLRTAGGIANRYHFVVTQLMLYIALAALLMLLFSIFLLPNAHRGWKARLAGVLICLALARGLYTQVYLDGALYDKTANNDILNYAMSDLETFVSRGFWYPFLRSIPSAFPYVPDGYNAREADAFLARYESKDIPTNKKVNVVGVMLEAFSDLTDFPMLAELDSVQELYAPLHELEAQSVSGDLLTNIFAGGTVESEWGFLTGFSHHSEFRTNVDSYVRYFKAQGYDAVYRHPGYGWFYNRQNVNDYLGFDESVFHENGFGELVDIEEALFLSDSILFDYLLRDLTERDDAAAPLFSFSVTFQNHGPYDSVPLEGGIVSGAGTAWTDESRGILDNYLKGIRDTITELRRFVDGLEALDKPVVLVLFGDHKPWLGNGAAVYHELGVNLDTDTLDGFYNYYSTPYLIWANSAAKRVLGSDFVGEGTDVSPCFLMTELFDLCGWDGPAFMALTRDVRKETPLVSSVGYYLLHGELLRSAQLPEDFYSFYLDYRRVEYRREHLPIK